MNGLTRTHRVGRFFCQLVCRIIGHRWGHWLGLTPSYDDLRQCYRCLLLQHRGRTDPHLPVTDVEPASERTTP